jgi:hypothetical protein
MARHIPHKEAMTLQDGDNVASEDVIDVYRTPVVAGRPSGNKSLSGRKSGSKVGTNQRFQYRMAYGAFHFFMKRRKEFGSQTSIGHNRIICRMTDFPLKNLFL